MVSDAKEGVDELVVGSLAGGGGGGVGRALSLLGVVAEELLPDVFVSFCTLATGDDLATALTAKTFSLFCDEASSSSLSFAESAPDETVLSTLLIIGERVLIGDRRRLLMGDRWSGDR